MRIILTSNKFYYYTYLVIYDFYLLICLACTEKQRSFYILSKLTSSIIKYLLLKNVENKVWNSFWRKNDIHSIFIVKIYIDRINNYYVNKDFISTIFHPHYHINRKCANHFHFWKRMNFPLRIFRPVKDLHCYSSSNFLFTNIHINNVNIET